MALEQLYYSATLEEAFSDLLGRKPLRKLSAVTEADSVLELLALTSLELTNALSRCGLKEMSAVIEQRLALSVPEPTAHIESSHDCSKPASQSSEERSASVLSPLLVDGSLPEQAGATVCAMLPWRCLCTLARSCRMTLPLHDRKLWLTHWEDRPSWDAPPSGDVKAAFLQRIRTACVECSVPTPYVFPLMNHLRLCEACEKSFAKYSLVSAVVCHEQGLRDADLRALGSLQGPKNYGLLYLRSQVERIRHGVSRVKKISSSSKGKTFKSHGTHRKAAGGRTNHDSCCFDVTGLQLAS